MGVDLAGFILTNYTPMNNTRDLR